MKKIVRFIRETNKRVLAKVVGFFFRRHSYSLFGIPCGLASLDSSTKELYPESRVLSEAPRTLDSTVFWRFRDRLEEVTQPAIGLFAVPHGYATRLGCNLTEKGRLITTYLQPIDGKAPNQQDIFRFSTKRFLPRILKVDKPVVTLSTGWQGAFYHWMYEVLPRLHLAEKGGYEKAQIFVEARTSFQKESLALLGLAESQIINADEFDALQTPQLIVPSIPRAPTGWGCRFLRDKMLPSITLLPKQKLYVSRGDARCRRILNEDQVWEFLKKEGFKRVEMSHLTFKQQIEQFHSAEIIVAPHGAALSHLVFCSKATQVLEIFSPSYVNVCYWTICNWMGFSYRYLFGKGKRYPDYFDPHVDPDIEVDLKELEMSLAQIKGIHSVESRT